MLHRAGEGELCSPFEPPASPEPARLGHGASRAVRRAGAAVAEHCAENGRGGCRCLPGARQPRGARASRNVAQFAAPACDSVSAPQSQPESHPADPVGAPDRPVFAGRIAPSATRGRTLLRRPYCRERPPKNLRSYGAMGVPQSHPSLEVAPGKTVPPEGGKPVTVLRPVYRRRRVAGNDAAAISAAPGRPRVRRDTPPNRS